MKETATTKKLKVIYGASLVALFVVLMAVYNYYSYSDSPKKFHLLDQLVYLGILLCLALVKFVFLKRTGHYLFAILNGIIPFLVWLPAVIDYWSGSRWHTALLGMIMCGLSIGYLMVETIALSRNSPGR